MIRTQLEKDQGGEISAVFDVAPTYAACTVTIKRGNGNDLEDTAIEDEALPTQPVPLIFPFGTNGAEGERVIYAGIAAFLPLDESIYTLYSYTRQEIQLVEIARAARVAGITTITLKQPLRFPVTYGDSMSANAVKCTVTAANCPRVEQNFRAVFAGDVLGVRVVREVIYDVGLRPSYCPATVVALYRKWPDLHQIVPEEWTETDAANALIEGWGLVSDSLWSAQINPNRLRNIDQMEPLVVNRAMWYMAQSGIIPTVWIENLPGFLEHLQSTFDRLFTTILAGVQWYDDDDDAVADDLESPLTIRSIQLLR